jgi:hypothetical protein
LAKSEEEKRSEAAKKGAETRRKNQEAEEKAEREATGPRKDSTPSGPISAGPESVDQTPADAERRRST